MPSYVRAAIALAAVLLLWAPPAGAVVIDSFSGESIPAGGMAPTQLGKFAHTPPPSSCASAKAVPAIDSPSSNFNVAGYTEQSVINESACITVSVSTSDPSCWSNGLSSASYLGSFDPAHIDSNYLGDPAGATIDANPITYSMVVPAGQALQTAVHMSAVGAGCPSYDISWSSDRPWAYFRPRIQGNPFVGTLLTGNFGAWTPSSLAFQWRRCKADGTGCADIAGATSANYTPAAGDVGYALVWRVTGTDSGVTSTSDSRRVVIGIPLEDLTARSLDGTEPTQAGRLGQDLNPSNCGTPKPAPPVISIATSRFYDAYGFTNSADGPLCMIAAVALPTACMPSGGLLSAAYLPSYQPAASLQANYLGDNGFAASPSNSVGSYSFNVPGGAAFQVMATTTTASATCSSYDLRLGSAAPYPTAAPVITGTSTAGQTLTLTDGVWTGSPTFTRQWQSCDASGGNCTAIAGATGDTFTVTAAEVGHRVRARVTATQGAGSAFKDAAATDVVPPLPVTPPPPYAGIALTARTVKVGRKGIVRLRLGCPAEAIRACAGTDRVKLKKQTLGSKSFQIAAGKSATVRVRLFRKARKRLAKRGKLGLAQVVVSYDARRLPVRTSAKLTLKRR